MAGTIVSTCGGLKILWPARAHHRQRPKRAAPSVRMRMMGDGWDDWEYLRTLEDLLARQSASPAATEARRVLNDARALVMRYGFEQADRALLAQYEVAPDHTLRKHDPAEFEYAADPEAFLI